jgi:hypothetical protein
MIAAPTQRAASHADDRRGGEDGVLTVTIRNTGNTHLAATRGHVTTDDLRLNLNGGAITFPASDPGQSVIGSLNVSLAPCTEALTPIINVTVSDPDFALAESALFTSHIRLNVHDEPKQSATDDFETPRTAWDIPASGRWSVLDLSSTQRVWQGTNYFPQTDASLDLAAVDCCSRASVADRLPSSLLVQYGHSGEWGSRPSGRRRRRTERRRRHYVERHRSVSVARLSCYADPRRSCESASRAASIRRP